MLAPSVIHTGLWIAIPVLATFALSLTDYDNLSAPKWIGLDNYVEICERPGVPQGHREHHRLHVLDGAGGDGDRRGDRRGAQPELRLPKWYRTAFFIPHVTATVAIAMVWLWIFNPQSGC